MNIRDLLKSVHKEALLALCEVDAVTDETAKDAWKKALLKRTKEEMAEVAVFLLEDADAAKSEASKILDEAMSEVQNEIGSKKATS